MPYIAGLKETQCQGARSATAPEQYFFWVLLLIDILYLNWVLASCNWSSSISSNLVNGWREDAFIVGFLLQNIKAVEICEVLTCSKQARANSAVFKKTHVGSGSV